MPYDRFLRFFYLTNAFLDVYIVASKDRRKFYITGHSEYDPYTLRDEYKRDFKKDLPISPPKNYFQEDDPSEPPIVKWRGHAHLLFSNWLNYYVYGKDFPAY
jgi:homoserine O-succinyltransferase